LNTGKINRIIDLLTTLQSGRNYSVEELICNLGVSRRTIFRDFKNLEAIGVPYHFDPKTGGYWIEKTYYLQPVDFKLNEALSILMLLHKARNLMPFPYHRSALMAGMKIENNLPAEVRKHCQISLSKIFVKKSRVVEHGDFEKLFDDMQKAIREKIIIAMTYKSLYDKKDIVIDVWPYHLMYNHRAWYLLAYWQEHKEVRTFKLTRIKHYQLLDRKFIDGDKFDAAEHFGKAWSMISEGRLWNVHLHFDPMVANNVSEVKWHCTQQVQWNTDGSVDMEFRVDGLGEISWWILGYGDKVKVIKPTELRKRLLNITENMTRNFRE